MTELEGCVLGVVWLRGPCTAYVVRQEFLQSESSQWSGSAGAIYPLLRRLEQQKLLRSAALAWGRGRRKQFAITSKGLAALRAWIGPPLPLWTAQPTSDPIRTRFSFLQTLPREKREQFLAEADANTAAELKQIERNLSRIDRKSDPFEYLAVLGTLHELRARAVWLREAQRWILGTGRRRK